MHTIKIHSDGHTTEYMAATNENLLQFLRKNEVTLESPCNGSGTCGKCKVRVTAANLQPPTTSEIRLLGNQSVSEGFRLSCAFSIQSDMDVYIPDQTASARIITEGMQRSIEHLPIVTKKNLRVDKPDLEDQRSDLDRIMNHAVSSWNTPTLEVIKNLPKILRQENYNITLVSAENQLLSVEAGDTTGKLYGVAIDIGTTTIAAYLLDLSTGRRICVNSLLNPQKIYGADVISRIKHTIDTPDGLDQLSKLVTDAINVSISALCMQTGINPWDIYAVTLAGNTTMLHLLMNISPRNLASAPFVPAFTGRLTVQAKELEILINPSGIVCVLPAVSAYIGADTVAAVLSTGMAIDEGVSLLIDIGTNGEMVLGSRSSLTACSAAAGPAFEGANIRNGMGSVNGAISSVSLEQGIRFTTIGDTKPIGICGSGLVDLLAQLLRAGIIDETGRLDMEWSPADPAQAALAGRLTTLDGINSFLLCKSEETLTGNAIALTQKDIREFQNAKAAIAAGIQVMLKETGIGYDQIEKVYLAGGLGSSINTDSALTIGLIPGELQGKILSVGNAAGQGAVEALLNKESLVFTDTIQAAIRYIELSANKAFNDFYIDCMMF